MSIKEPLVSIVIPVYNRRKELVSCLVSVIGQTYGNFEAIVIDDCSTVMVQDIAERFGDPRIRYVRNEKNGGPYNARTVGWQIAKGDYIVNLDSDWEAFPWLLERVVRYFDDTPEADAVTGMFLRNEDSRVFVRVKGGKKLITPDDASSLPAISDCIGGVRRCVIDEWLQKSHDYYALEAHAWLTFSLKHSQLYVDEPWALYHVDATERVTRVLARRNIRHVDDCLRFLDEHDWVLRTVPRKDIDRMLMTVAAILLKNGAWEGGMRCFFYMRKRNVNIANFFSRFILSAAASRLRRFFGSRPKTAHVTWI